MERDGTEDLLREILGELQTRNRLTEEGHRLTEKILEEYRQSHEALANGIGRVEQTANATYHLLTAPKISQPKLSPAGRVDLYLLCSKRSGTWKGGWRHIAAIRRRVEPAGHYFADDPEMVPVHARIASVRLAHEAVEILTVMINILCARAKEDQDPELLELARKCERWRGVWSAVVVAHATGQVPAGPVDDWEEFITHPDYVDLCVRTASVEVATETHEQLTRLSEFFAGEARLARRMAS